MTTVAELTSLELVQAGVYEVRTKDSTYTINLDQMTFVRQPDSVFAGQLKRGNTGNLYRLDRCTVGQPMWIVDQYDKTVGACRQIHSTPVRSIRPVQ